MRRLFWVALGAAAGVVFVRQVKKKAQAFAPSRLGRSVAGLGDSLRAFAEDVRAGMAEREYELSAAMDQGKREDPEAKRHLPGDAERDDRDPHQAGPDQERGLR
jgi:Sec-independent protein translocase protein TatA